MLRLKVFSGCSKVQHDGRRKRLNPGGTDRLARVHYTIFSFRSVFESVAQIDFERDPLIPGIKAMFADASKTGKLTKIPGIPSSCK
jgi:hypothetical protein